MYRQAATAMPTGHRAAVDQRRALFVGLWPPMLWLIGDALRDAERERGRRGRALLARLCG